MVDLPNMQPSGCSFDLYRKRDEGSSEFTGIFDFKNKGLRTLKGFNEFIDWCDNIPGWDFNFNGNYIQDIDELFKSNFKEEFSNKKIYLNNNPLSPATKERCRLHNERLNNKYNGGLLKYEQTWEVSQKNIIEKNLKNESEIKLRLSPSVGPLFTLWTVQAALILASVYKLSSFFADIALFGAKKISPLKISHYFASSRFKKLGLQIFMVGGIGLAFFKFRHSRIGRMLLNTIDTIYKLNNSKIAKPMYDWLNKDLSAALADNEKEFEEQMNQLLSKKATFEFYIIYDK